jgi:DNA adenine methylase
MKKQEIKIQPVIKWVGGKRQLLDKIKKRLPEKYNHYYEPFAGGLAVLLELQPEKATINDINSELINLYKTIKNHPKKFLKELDKLDKVDCNKDFYIETRKKYNNKIAKKQHDIELAALFVWLNKHCFNGLYRVNKKGEFNVPYNNKDGVSVSASKENVLEMSKYFQNVEILNGDFEKCVESAKEGDFIFFDSPYAPINATSFDDYAKEGFEEKDHRRLAKLFKELANKGCYCMLTNHNTPLIRELYKDYTIDVVEVKRMVNRNANERTGTEVIIRNYK